MAKTYTINTKFNAIDGITKNTKRMGESVGNLSKRVRVSTNNMKKSFMGVGTVMGGILGAGLLSRGFSALTQQAKSFVTEAQKIEDATAGFTPLMGGVKKATKLVSELTKTAATTPFQFEQISKASKQLLPVMNQDINKTVETFRMLGDTAGGNAQKLDSITRGYTKAMLKGKVDMESLNMIAEAGVPIYKELAASLGVTTAEMMEMSRRGEITSGDLTESFKRMTAEGGVFYKGMIVSSKTTSGVFSTMADNINMLKARIGTYLLPTIKEMSVKIIDVAQKMSEWVEANQDLIKIKVENFFSVMEKASGIVIKIIKILWKLIKVIINIWKWTNNLIASAWKVLVVIWKILIIMKKIIKVLSIRAWEWFANIIEKVKGALVSAWEWFTNILGIIWKVLGIIWKVIKVLSMNVWEWFTNILEKVKVALVSAWEWFKNIMNVVWKVIKAFSPLGIAIRGITEGFAIIKDGFGNGFLEGIKSIGVAILNFILNPLQEFLALLSKIPGLSKLGDISSKLDFAPKPNDANIGNTTNTNIAKNTVDVNFNDVPKNVDISSDVPSYADTNVSVMRMR